MRENLEALQHEITKVIIGKDDVVAKVLMAVLAGGHVLLEDVPGVGKTTLTLAFANALGLETKRMQFTSDSVPSDVVGFSVIDQDTGEFAYKPGAIMTNILLADEINRTSSKTQSALLEAMEEGQVTVDGLTHRLPSPFLVLATQNPVGSAGTQMLPASQLDRFMIRLTIGYPDAESQTIILQDRHSGNPLESMLRILSQAELIDSIERVAKVHIDDRIYRYITQITEATRSHPAVKLGASPRGALALTRMTKAKAYVSGRDFVVPEDVAAVAVDVFAHRLIIDSRARYDDLNDADIVRDILDQVPMPVLAERN